MAAKALILRAFISLLAQRQITSTHISRKPMARRPMYMNSLMTESQRTPGSRSRKKKERGKENVKSRLSHLSCKEQEVEAILPFATSCKCNCGSNGVQVIFLIFSALSNRDELVPTLCFSWRQLNEAATLFFLIIT